MTPRLKTALWVQVQVRLCDRNLISIAVTRKGDPDAGSILLKLLRRENRCMVLRRITTLDGNMGWMVVAGTGEIPEEEAQAYTQREMGPTVTSGSSKSKIPKAATSWTVPSKPEG